MVAFIAAVLVQMTGAVIAIEHLARELSRIREAVERGERRSPTDRRKAQNASYDD